MREVTPESSSARWDEEGDVSTAVLSFRLQQLRRSARRPIVEAASDAVPAWHESRRESPRVRRARRSIHGSARKPRGSKNKVGVAPVGVAQLETVLSYRDMI